MRDAMGNGYLGEEAEGGAKENLLKLKSGNLSRSLSVNERFDEIHHWFVFFGGCDSLLVVELLIDILLVLVGAFLDQDGDLHRLSVFDFSLDFHSDSQADVDCVGALRHGGLPVDSQSKLATSLLH
jgi:hypothetical protein